MWACLIDSQMELEQEEEEVRGREIEKEMLMVMQMERRLLTVDYCVLQMAGKSSFRRFVFYDISSLAAPTNAAQCGRGEEGEGSVGQRNHFILLTVVTKIAHCLLPAAAASASATALACCLLPLRQQQSRKRPSSKFAATRLIVSEVPSNQHMQIEISYKQDKYEVSYTALQSILLFDWTT